MFRGLKNLLLVGILFYGINMGLAQESQQPENNTVGRAYEFSGLSRFVKAPSQFVFGNNTWDGADIVDGYRVPPARLDAIDPEVLAHFIVLSQEVRSEWWRQPIYYEIHNYNQNYTGIFEVVVLAPNSDIFNDHFGSEFSPEQFVVDSNIRDRIENPGTNFTLQ